MSTLLRHVRYRRPNINLLSLSVSRLSSIAVPSRFIHSPVFPPWSAHPPPPTITQHFIRAFGSDCCGGHHSKTTVNTKVNFSPPGSDSDSDSDEAADHQKKNYTSPSNRGEIDKSKLPPPYDPFNKRPAAVEDPEDPKDLQKIFHKMRSEDGLFNNAVKMFDELSKDGLTHEALELFSQIKDKGQMPDVVAHTAVIEAYANAGQSKEALKVFLRMLNCGVAPNAYTYAILIKGLAAGGRIGDAKKYVVEMMGKGMRPNAGTYCAVFEALAREQRVEEGRELLEQMKAKGFSPDEKAVREVIGSKRGAVFRTVINLLFGK
ncbi:unnamed protein product [Linum tenue]|uniref:Pentatricopeptide repeat-containing protein n=1 Tax=Linum tenue TaxID=586396 RepID=A0AAV0S3N0_9ROSI|nr:unnamed protein product [Linum tenue]